MRTVTDGRNGTLKRRQLHQRGKHRGRKKEVTARGVYGIVGKFHFTCGSGTILFGVLYGSGTIQGVLN
jgi:hypothetical protein